MEKSNFIFNDGGREAAGYKGKAGDCVTRAICIATGKPYKEVYDTIHQLNQRHANNGTGRLAKKIKSGGGKRGTTPRNGVSKTIYHPYLLSLRFNWTPTMMIGQGCKTHLKADELPTGVIIARVSKHLVTVINGIPQDTFDCSRSGTRCVYGYYSKQQNG